MSLRSRLQRAERKAAASSEVLRLPDGTEVKYSASEMLEALSATIRRQDHRLRPHVRASGTNEGLPGLVRALQESRERVEAEDES